MTDSSARILVDSLGELYTEIKSVCTNECVKLLETQELTVAEKDCANNCFRKFGRAYAKFGNLSFAEIEKYETYRQNI